LRILASGATGREVVLALPLSRLLLRIVRVPAGEDPVEVAAPVLKAASPFPDEPLTVGVEVVRENETEKIVIAAALPESATDDIGEALDAAKFSVVRIDSLALGQIRGVWAALGESADRRAVLIRGVDCISLLVLDGDLPVAIRAISEGQDLRREVMLSLLEAEDFGGARKLTEVIVVDSREEGEAGGESEEGFKALSSFAPVRKLAVGSDAALVGVQERAMDAASLNVLPESWREMLEETRLKAKLVRGVAIAGGIWALVMAVLLGVPSVYKFMEDSQRDLSRQHRRQYEAVKAMRDKVDVVRKYSDHERTALEIMKAVSDHLPDGVTLTSWSYARDEGVWIDGETAVKDETYALKETLEALPTKDGEGRLFEVVELSGVRSVKGLWQFKITCLYKAKEEGE